MSTIALIDTTAMSVVKTSDEVEPLEYWAAIEIPVNDFTIRDATTQALKVFTRAEAERLYANLAMRVPPCALDNDALLARITQLIDELPQDTTSVEDLKKRHGKELTMDYTSPDEDDDISPVIPTRTNRRARSTEGEPPSRPAAGTTTARVWDIADQLFLKHGDMPPRQEIIDACTLNDIHPSTAATQYSKWKRNKLGT